MRYLQMYWENWSLINVCFSFSFFIFSWYLAFVFIFSLIDVWFLANVLFKLFITIFSDIYNIYNIFDIFKNIVLHETANDCLFLCQETCAYAKIKVSTCLEIG